LQVASLANTIVRFRKGRVQFDGWHFTSRLVDLPTVIESQKTIDSKTFYKTADICQILICKVFDAPHSSDSFPVFAALRNYIVL
jgi:TATA-binding protein-associated factor Taf7